MSEMEQLAARLKKKKLDAEAEAKAAKEAAETQFLAWTDSLNKLMASIQAWLEPMTREGVAEVHLSNKEIVDQASPGFKATYLAPVLILSINGFAARIEPFGLQESGGQGRVEIMAREHNFELVRGEGDTWLISQQSLRGGQGVVLDQDTLARAFTHYADYKPS